MAASSDQDLSHLMEIGYSGDSAAFDDEALRQSRMAAGADADDPELDAFMDAALADMDLD